MFSLVICMTPDILLCTFSMIEGILYILMNFYRMYEIINFMIIMYLNDIKCRF